MPLNKRKILYNCTRESAVVGNTQVEYVSLARLIKNWSGILVMTCDSDVSKASVVTLAMMCGIKPVACSTTVSTRSPMTFVNTVVFIDSEEAREFIKQYKDS